MITRIDTLMTPMETRINKFGKNAHTPPKLSTTGQKTPSTFIMANLLLKLFITAKLIHPLLGVKKLTFKSREKHTNITKMNHLSWEGKEKPGLERGR